LVLLFKEERFYQSFAGNVPTFLEKSGSKNTSFILQPLLLILLQLAYLQGQSLMSSPSIKDGASKGAFLGKRLLSAACLLYNRM